MKTMKYFLSMAALALVGAMMTGCSSDDKFDNPQQPENKNNLVTLTTTVGFADDGTTRALTPTGVKTFAEGDKIAISYYSNTSGEFVKAMSEPLQAGDITNDGKNATFTVTLDNPDKTKAVSYVYPAAMLNDDLTPNYDALFNHQDGTLTKLGSTFDYCLKQGNWNGENLPSLTLENRLAILAITLKNADGSSDINNTITSMVVCDGTNSYTINRTPAADPIYVAILPTSGATISVTATDGTKNYTKTLTTSKTYAASKGYNVSWRMAEALPALSITSPSVGQVIGSDGKNYDYANLPSGVTAVAKICYVSGSNGLALALTDEGQMIWSTAQTTCAAHTPAFTGGTWKLATKDEWSNMISAAGGASALRNGFSSVGGTNLQPELYWSSTEYGPGSAWDYYFNYGLWFHETKDNSCYVRACLAF